MFLNVGVPANAGMAQQPATTFQPTVPPGGGTIPLGGMPTPVTAGLPLSPGSLTYGPLFLPPTFAPFQPVATFLPVQTPGLTISLQPGAPFPLPTPAQVADALKAAGAVLTLFPGIGTTVGLTARGTQVIGALGTLAGTLVGGAPFFGATPAAAPLPAQTPSPGAI
jgi:hypothetical protein